MNASSSQALWLACPGILEWPYPHFSCKLRLLKLMIVMSLLDVMFHEVPQAWSGVLNCVHTVTCITNRSNFALGVTPLGKAPNRGKSITIII